MDKTRDTEQNIKKSLFVLQRWISYVAMLEYAGVKMKAEDKPLRELQRLLCGVLFPFQTSYSLEELCISVQA